MITLNRIQDWDINYSTYVDTLRLFAKEIYATKSNELIKKNFDGFTIVYFRGGVEPALFEMKHASKRLGEVDNLTKEAIIQRVIKYLENEPSR